ncbi:MAG: HAMP domain-containing histidine kinase [Sulfurospirillum sp.]|nr:HAMP domain-containing histidine kinase [Sulfurospirillum sp.]
MRVSILFKISILFCVSLAIMLTITLQTNKVIDEKIATLIKEKYIQSSKELLNLLVNANMQGIEKLIQKLDFAFLEDIEQENATVVYEKKISFGAVKILKLSGEHFLYIQYLDDKILLHDVSKMQDTEHKEKLHFLISADLFLLVGIFIIILKILFPLKKIAQALDQFGSGDYSQRLQYVKGSDEIAFVTQKFNTMAENIQTLIAAREQLLRDMSHELRTPISKAKFALEMLQPNKYTQMLKKSIDQLDSLTHELLELEKLGSKNIVLEKKRYCVEELLLETLSRLMAVDENEISIEIRHNFEAVFDLKYLSIVVKNLLDNALKYKESGVVVVLADNNTLYIKNKAKPLQKPLDYYTQLFTQGDNSRGATGYGLGLNMIMRVLKEHGLELAYRYEDGYNCFFVQFPNS